MLADTERLVDELHEPGPGRARPDRRRSLLAVLGHPAADAGVGRARPPPRRPAPHAPRRDPRGGGRTAWSSTAARRSSTSRTSAGSGADVWCAHCVHLSADDVADFAASGTGVAHCPTSNLRLGAGIAPVRELVEAGRARRPRRRRLGVERAQRPPLRGEAGAPRRARRGGPAALTARQALRLGTRGGAAVLRRDDIGSLEPGKQADLRGLAHGRPRARGRGGPRRRARAHRAAPRRPARRRRRGRRPRRRPRQRRRGGDRPRATAAGAKVRPVAG